jgi:hypothetical protein
MTYEVRDGDGNSVTTGDLRLAREIRKLLLNLGASVAVIWDDAGMRVES